MSFLPIYVYFIIISFLASSSVYFTSLKSQFYLKLFPPFLLTTIIIEVIGSYLSSIGKSNIGLYNFFSAFEFCFYLYIISRAIGNKKIKSVVIITLFLYVIIAVSNIVFIQKIRNFHTVTYALGCLLIVATCIYYFFELFRIPKSVELINNPTFWICSGLLFYYCCGFPLFGLTNFLYSISKLIIKNLHTIIIILNIFLYTLFTVAFLCRVKVRKYIS
jgi:hypothetical protein